MDVKTDVRICLQAMVRPCRPFCALGRVLTPPPAQVCPCAFYGETMRRGLVLNAYFHLLLFLVLFNLFWFVGSIKRSKCGPNPAAPPPPYYPPSPPATSSDFSPAPPPTPVLPLAQYTACIASANSTTGYLFILCFLFMLYSAVRRHQMRVKFGFPNHSWKTAAWDVYAWVCCTLCVVCQEARTLRYNNVEDGAWHGPEITLRGRDIAAEIERAQAAAAVGGRLDRRLARNAGEGTYTLYAGFGGGLLHGLQQHSEEAAGETVASGMVRQEDDDEEEWGSSEGEEGEEGEGRDLHSDLAAAAGGAQAELFAGGLPAFVPPPPPSRMEALAIEIDRHQKLEAGIAVHAKTRTDRGELFKR